MKPKKKNLNYKNSINNKIDSVKNIELSEINFFDYVFIFLFACFVLLEAFTFELTLDFEISKWLPFFTIPFFALGFYFSHFYLLKNYKNDHPIKYFYYAGLLTLLLILWWGLNFVILTFEYYKIEYWVFLIILFPLPIMLSDVKQSKHTILSYSIFSIFTFFAIQHLPNFADIKNSISFDQNSNLQNSSMGSVILTWVGFIISYILVYISFYKKNESNQRSNNYNWIIDISLIIVIFLLSFRIDNLFIATSKLHWEYFVGPIQTIRSGGELFWSTPSQYGFLNILIPSILPIESEWQSFYIFQSSLLFIVSLFGLFIIKNLSQTITHRMIYSLIFILALNFADSGLIGPTTYPSSSVVRFFCCYLLLFLVFCSYLKNWSEKQTFWIIGGAWVLTSFWSSESFIYTTTCTFLFFLGQSISLSATISEGFYKTLRKSIYLILFFILYLLLFVTLYWITTNHFPDLFMFIEHGFSYAGGYGSLPLYKYGAVWALLLLFYISLTWSLNTIKSQNTKLIPMGFFLMGLIWAISSYFVGRAAPNNVVAMLPQITIMIIVFLNLKSTNSINNSTFGIFQKSFSFLFLFLILSTVFANSKLPTFLEDFDFLTTNIETHKDFSPELEDLLKKYISPTKQESIVFYGVDGSMPYSPQFAQWRRTWLPVPLQLSEVPISDERAHIIFDRFFQKNNSGGYFVQRNRDYTLRDQKWFSFLSQYFKIKKIAESTNFLLFKFDPNTTK